MPESNVVPLHSAPALRGVPTLLDCLRIELEAARNRGREPVKLLVHGDCSLILCEVAEAEGELDRNASPARILDLPLMMSNELISAAEGARIVCEGDELHARMMRRRAERLAS